jgi:hypothetical protein
MSDADFDRLAQRLNVELASIKRQITQRRGQQTTPEVQEAIGNFDSALGHLMAELAAAETERTQLDEERHQLLLAHLERSDAASERVVTAFEDLAAAKQAVKKLFAERAPKSTTNVAAAT